MHSVRSLKTCRLFSSRTGTVFVELLVILPVLLLATWLVAGIGAGVWGTWVLGQAAENGVLVWQQRGIGAVTEVVTTTLLTDGFAATPTITTSTTADMAIVQVRVTVHLVGWPFPVTLRASRSLATMASGPPGEVV